MLLGSCLGPAKLIQHVRLHIRVAPLEMLTHHHAAVVRVIIAENYGVACDVIIWPEGCSDAAKLLQSAGLMLTNANTGSFMS